MTDEAKEMISRGHTLYAVVYQMKQWYGVEVTEAQISKAIGK